jgi:hypothetical protein
LKTETKNHNWKFVQNGGLVQVQISTIEDVLNLDSLDPKFWTALACPVSGLEFSEETLSLLDVDNNGRVRVPEILNVVKYIKKYFKNPEIIMKEGDSIPLEALGDVDFCGGHSPKEAAKSVLQILGKSEATEISYEDVANSDKLFSSSVINGDGVLPSDCISETDIASVVKDIINCTGGTYDICGEKGITRSQKEEFFAFAKNIKDWRETAAKDDPKIFFLKEKTDAAAAAFVKVRDKINDFYLRCSLINYDENAKSILKAQTDKMFCAEDGSLFSKEKLAELPIATCEAGKSLPLDSTINPAWETEITDFKENVIKYLFEKEIISLSEKNWRKIENCFAPYLAWYEAMPKNPVSVLGLDRITEILNSNAEKIIDEYLSKEENHPPIVLASVELKKMILIRRDFLKLLRNFVSFVDFYTPEEKAIFQCGTLFIDGRSCELCFKVLDIAKHGTMASLSQCFLVYCDCVKKDDSGEKMQIAALISNGSTDNLLVGRNGMFFDRQGNDWDATIIKIIDNPVSIKQAFWAPYKKIMRLIQEKIAKTTSAAESKVFDTMAKVVDNPNEAASQNTSAKKTDVGTIAAISVAFTGIATVVGGVMEAFLGLGAWIPLGILGIILLISTPSVLIAWRKLRLRNIAPILDASGWAVNGNVRIPTLLGDSLTKLPVYSAKSFVLSKDPYAVKKFPIKRVIFVTVLILLIVIAFVLVIKNPEGIKGVWKNMQNLFAKFSIK